MQTLAHDDRQQRRQQEGIGSGFELQMKIRLFGGLGTAGIDHDHRALRVFLQVAQGVACIGNAVRLVGIAADEEDIVGMFDIFCGVAGLAAEQTTVGPEVSGFLLPQCVVGIACLLYTSRCV